MDENLQSRGKLMLSKLGIRLQHEKTLGVVETDEGCKEITFEEHKEQNENTTLIELQNVFSSFEPGSQSSFNLLSTSPDPSPNYTDLGALQTFSPLTMENPIEPNSWCLPTSLPSTSSTSQNKADEAETSDSVEFEHDSDTDPDFINDFYLSSSSSESPPSKSVSLVKKKKTSHNSTSSSVHNFSSDNNGTLPAKSRTRKPLSFPTEWKRNKAKYLRNTGKCYQTLKKGLEISGRKMHPPCGEKCRLLCSKKFTEEERLTLFSNYWAIGDINKQRSYILNCMLTISHNVKKLDTENYKQPRKPNNAFYFYRGSDKIRVCKVFFVSTLGITNRCIRTVVNKSSDGIVEDDQRGKHIKHQVSKCMKDGVRFHISKIPTIESHYTRANTQKLYIDGSKTIADLYRDYKMECEKDGKEFVTESMYSNIFNREFNLSFFTPKKDQCQKCVSYDNADVEQKEKMQAEIDLHKEEKELSRLEKAKDKEKSNNLYKVVCFDLQAVLPVPRGDVSSFYYKSKLSTYNFTVCELQRKGNGDVYCYLWHEGEGKRGANEIGSCLLNFFKSKAAESDSDDLELVLYSDNCCGQQKNKYLISLYLYAVSNLKIKSITHKFLVSGHTQNEGDAVHSLIEKNIKRSLKSGPIYIPGQYATLIATAKKSGAPFKVIELSHNDFFDLKQLCDRTATNFNQNVQGESLKFTDVSIFKVEKNAEDKVFYKMSFRDQEFKVINVKETRTRNTKLPFSSIEIQPCYSSRIPISKRKYQDIQSLLNSNHIPKCYSIFFNTLVYYDE